MAKQEAPENIGGHSRLVESRREAKVTVYDGSPVGLCLFLSVSDLAELEISINQSQSTTVEYSIDPTTGQLKIQSSSRD